MDGCLSKQRKNSYWPINRKSSSCWTRACMIEREIEMHLSKGGADVLIVQTAVDYATTVL